MLLFVFSSDGGAREDGNVFHAAFLLVAADRSASAAVEAVITGHVNGVKEAGDIWYTWETEDPADDLSTLVQELAKAGFPAQVMEPAFVLAKSF